MAFGQRLAMGCNASSKASGPPSMYTLEYVPLGSGHSRVYRGVEKSTSNVVAVKAFSKSQSERIKIEGEIDILRRFSNHPNIVDFVCSYETSSEIHMVVEYMYGGGLFNVIPAHGLESEDDAAKYTKGIAAALCYLHRNCVAHRNLKPTSLMLSHALGGDLKLCDFGCAKSLPTEDAPMWDPCGTWAYAAPEILWLQRTSEGSYTLKCDLFPVGVILYYLLVGYHPFDPFGKDTREEMCDKICHGVWGFDRNPWYGVSPEAKSVVTALLEVDPKKRIKARQLACHPWIRGSISFGRAVCVKAPPEELTTSNEQSREQSHPTPSQASLSPSNKGRDSQPGSAPPSSPMNRRALSNPRRNKSAAEIQSKTNQPALTSGRPRKSTSV